MPKSRRNQRRTKKQRKQKTKKILGAWWVVCGLLVIGMLICFFLNLTKVEKFFYVVKMDDGGAEVVVVDPANQSVNSLQIPSNTQLDLSDNLGIYKLESAWKLAEDEGLGGELITKSMVKNFSLPIYLWKSENDTNLGVFKQIRVWLISKKLTNYQVSNIDLSKTPAITKTRIKDGSDGYLVVGSIPSYILVNFVDNQISDNLVKVEIIDSSGSFFISDKVSSVLSVMGAKVSSFSKTAVDDFNCEVGGKNKLSIEKIAKVLGCEKNPSLKGDSDVIIKLGSKFAKLF